MGERIQRWVKMEGTEEGNSETDVREAGARGIQVERYPRCVNNPLTDVRVVAHLPLNASAPPSQR